MVWLAGDDLVRPEQLLQQHDARKLVRESDPSEREAFVGPLEHAGGKAERAAHDKAQVARLAAILDQLCEVGARALGSLPVQHADERSRGHAAKNVHRLLLEQLCPSARISARLL